MSTDGYVASPSFHVDQQQHNADQQQTQELTHSLALRSVRKRKRHPTNPPPLRCPLFLLPHLASMQQELNPSTYLIIAGTAAPTIIIRNSCPACDPPGSTYPYPSNQPKPTSQRLFSSTSPTHPLKIGHRYICWRDLPPFFRTFFCLRHSLLRAADWWGGIPRLGEPYRLRFALMLV